MKIETNFTKDLQKQMQEWRHAIHQKPELDFNLDNTSSMVASLLKEFGLEVHERIGKSGIVAILKKGKGTDSIGLRADMDALKIQEENTFAHCSKEKGKMHACGHDGHTAMLLGAAKYLALHGTFNGSVYFIFQPAEEHGLGAKAMINDGLFDKFNINSIYAIHNFPSLQTGHFAIKEGAVMAAEDNFEITINAIGHHAAMPHLGKDAIVIASQIVGAIQNIVSRNIDPMQNAVISFTEFITNGTVNVVPGQVILKGDTRSLSLEVQKQIEESMHRVVKGICLSHEVSYEFSYIKNFCPTINTRIEANIAAKIAGEIVGEHKVITNSKEVMTSEDFGWMLKEKKGAYILLGNGKGETEGISLHNPKYDFNDKILNDGADFWVHLVQSCLK
ncbi:MAG: amidohydrolase [Campylobacteraceae bacterium]|nr:amidohydrolase [Campylobacteraceae bacterium]